MKKVKTCEFCGALYTDDDPFCCQIQSIDTYREQRERYIRARNRAERAEARAVEMEETSC